jgi:hypothetical protein
MRLLDDPDAVTLKGIEQSVGESQSGFRELALLLPAAWPGPLSERPSRQSGYDARGMRFDRSLHRARRARR